MYIKIQLKSIFHLKFQTPSTLNLLLDVRERKEGGRGKDLFVQIEKWQSDKSENVKTTFNTRAIISKCNLVTFKWDDLDQKRSSDVKGVTDGFRCNKHNISSSYFPTLFIYYNFCFYKNIIFQRCVWQVRGGELLSLDIIDSIWKQTLSGGEANCGTKVVIARRRLACNKSFMRIGHQARSRFRYECGSGRLP